MGEQDAASLRAMASLATPMALRVAVTLGLPELLTGEGASVLMVAEELEASIVGLANEYHLAA